MRPHRKTQYADPVLIGISRVPFIDSRKWSKVWQSKRPHKVTRLRWWYTENDGKVISLLRVLTAISPPALLWLNINIAFVLTVVLAGVFFTEWLSEKREALKREQWKEELEREQRQARQERRETNPLIP